MRERDLYRAIDKLLPKSIHRQSMTGAALTGNGIPDRYYDGKYADLWVEYKQIASWPRNGLVVPALTPLQHRWLMRRYAAHSGAKKSPNAIVIVGLPGRPTTALLMTDCVAWTAGLHVDRALSLKEIAGWIAEYCGA